MLNFNNKVPTDIKIGNKTVETVWMRNEIVWGRVQTPLYIQNTYNGTNTVSVKQTLSGSPDSSTYAKHLQYSKDGLNWTTITLSSTAYTISLAKNEKVYFRGNEGVFNYWTSSGSQKAITTISASQNHTVGGNINSLLDYTDPYCLTLPQGAFNSMFENDTHLTSASDLTLPSSLDGSLPTYAYLYMFKGCSSLISAPQSILAKVQGQDACNGMFANCTSLTTSPALPATTLANACYWSMFEGCTALTSAPVLPATTVTSSCYRSMFQGCTSLTTAPELPATTMIGSYCYQAMFRNCSSLTTTPSVLPATTAKFQCYQRMFSECTALTTAPALPATTLESGCYQYMFFGCTSLTTAPTELPANTLVLNCYYSMFEGCNKLTSSPVIKATTFAKQSCTAMFRNCTLLNNVTVCANDNSAENCTQNWLNNVAATGTFYNYGTATYTINSASGIPVGWTEKKPEMNCFYVKNESSSKSNVDIIVRGTPQSNKTATSVQYSYDKYIWNTINFSPNTVYNIPLNVSQKVYLRNGNGFWSAANTAFIKILSNKDYSVGGKLSTLYDCYDESHPVYEYCFHRLFSPESTDSSIYDKQQNDTLVDASMLQLIDTNRLPVRTLSGVQGRTIPEHLYKEMFDHCVNLLHSPEEVYGEYVSEQGCYKMFYWCQKLLDAPKLSPTFVNFQGYYGMFMGCLSLITVPELLMTKVYNSACENMFYRCNKMTGNPILLPETIGNNTYESMFEQCTSLTEVTLYLRYYSGNSYDSHKGVYNFLKDANPNGGTIHNLGGFSSGYWAPSGWVVSNS